MKKKKEERLEKGYYYVLVTHTHKSPTKQKKGNEKEKEKAQNLYIKKIEYEISMKTFHLICILLLCIYNLQYYL